MHGLNGWSGLASGQPMIHWPEDLNIQKWPACAMYMERRHVPRKGTEDVKVDAWALRLIKNTPGARSCERANIWTWKCPPRILRIDRALEQCGCEDLAWTEMRSWTADRALQSLN